MKIAFPAHRFVRSLLCVSLSLTVLVCSAWAAPANDNFASAQMLNGNVGSVNGSNVDATKEVGEPNHIPYAGANASIWYRWQAASSGTVTIHTAGSSFDTILAVYTGSSLTALTQIDYDDNVFDGVKTSSVTFDAVSGTTYRIAVAGGGFGQTVPQGDVTLSWVLGSPLNDNFSGAQTLAGEMGTAIANNVGATKESGEPNHAGATGGASIWFKWQAPVSRNVTFITYKSTFDTLLAVYQGASVGALTTVAANDNAYASGESSCGDNGRFSRTSFDAVQGATYYIAVDRNNSFGSNTSGDVFLRWGVSAKIEVQITDVNGNLFSSGRGVLSGDACGKITSGASSPNLPTGGNYAVSAELSGAQSFSICGPERSGPTAPLAGDVTLRYYQCTPAYTVAGTVNSPGGGPLGGVTMRVSGPRNYQQTTITTADGKYAFSGLIIHGNYTVAPISGDYNFNPSSNNYPGIAGNYANQNFAAQARLEQTINFSPVPSKTYADQPFALSATATSTLPVVFTIISGPVELSGNVVTIKGVGTVQIQASQPGNNSFKAAPNVVRSFAVAKAPTTITLGNLSHTYDGAAKSASAATAPAKLSGLSISYNGAPSAPTNAGSYQVVASLENNNYTAPNATGTLTIRKAIPTVTWADPASIAYGTALGGDQLNASADVPGAFTYSPPAGTILPAGNGQQLSATFTPTDTANYDVVKVTARVSVRSAETSSSVIKFSAASYAASEDAESVTITLARSGDASRSASVNYATSDDAPPVNCLTTTGHASARCDYATRLGAVSFAAGETSKNITIPLIDDGHIEGGETFFVTLSDATGATLGAQTIASVNITDNDATPAASNYIDKAPFFVRMHYLDFLSREPEPGGFADWNNTLNNCPDANNYPRCDRLHVSSSFFRSDEFQVKGFFVYRYYKLSLGRRPTYAEIVADMVRVTGETAAERIGKQNQFADSWLERPEVRATFGPLTDAAFLDLLERNAGAPLADRGQMLADLSSGARSRAKVLRDATESQAVAAQLYNEAFVAMQYYSYLRREPEEQGFNDWLNTIEQNPADVRRMVSGFINSVEYRNRFGN